MPEVEFVVEWPGGARERCYSPSRAIREHLSAGTDYALREFLDRARLGLWAAAERVNTVHGFRCPRALEQLRILEQRAEAFPGKDSLVRVLSIDVLGE
jgi:uncharacterized repeat protein (TIGR04042 family)